MNNIQTCGLPEDALLNAYAGKEGSYTDCFVTETGSPVDLARYVEAFYTTPLFKLERLVLTYLASMPSTDVDAKQVANSETENFAAWSVEKRSENQLLMCDFRKRTRSWFMVETLADEDGTRLYFGSAVVPVHDNKTGTKKMGGAFNLLLGFHRLYSKLLLSSAKSRLQTRKLLQHS